MKKIVILVVFGIILSETVFAESFSKADVKLLLQKIDKLQRTVNKLQREIKDLRTRIAKLESNSANVRSRQGKEIIRSRTSAIVSSPLEGYTDNPKIAIKPNYKYKSKVEKRNIRRRRFTRSQWRRRKIKGFPPLSVGPLPPSAKRKYRRKAHRMVPRATLPPAASIP